MSVIKGEKRLRDAKRQPVYYMRTCEGPECQIVKNEGPKPSPSPKTRDALVAHEGVTARGHTRHTACYIVFYFTSVYRSKSTVRGSPLPPTRGDVGCCRCPMESTSRPCRIHHLYFKRDTVSLSIRSTGTRVILRRIRKDSSGTFAATASRRYNTPFVRTTVL
jgi:hypothetical protein